MIAVEQTVRPKFTRGNGYVITDEPLARRHRPPQSGSRLNGQQLQLLRRLRVAFERYWQAPHSDEALLRRARRVRRLLNELNL